MTSELTSMAAEELRALHVMLAKGMADRSKEIDKLWLEQKKDGLLLREVEKEQEARSRARVKVTQVKRGASGKRKPKGLLERLLEAGLSREQAMKAIESMAQSKGDAE